MSNIMRWRYGDTNPVVLAVDADTAIEIGDLVYLDLDDAKPASSQTDQGSETLNQQAFHSSFAGVAMQCSPAGEAGVVRVATTGVFEFACAAGLFEVGDLVGAVEQASGTALEDQKVASVASAASAVGRCAARATTGVTRVLVDITSSVMKGGVQAVA